MIRSGRLGVRIENTSTEWFGPVVMNGDVRAVVSVILNSGDVTVQINKHDLPAWTKTQEPLELDGTVATERPMVSIDPSLGGSKAEVFFLETIRDLQMKLLSGSPYETIKAAGLLRVLLLDGFPLANRVKRRFGMVLQFETSDFRSKLPLEPDMHWMSLDASGFPDAKVLQINLAEFLGAFCLSYKSKIAKVMDVINACAHVKGGVHFGDPKKDGEKLVCGLDEVMKITSEEASLVAMRGICMVALKGLEPLVHAIQSKT